jgi:hypothetical protein
VTRYTQHDRVQIYFLMRQWRNRGWREMKECLPLTHYIKILGRTIDKFWKIERDQERTAMVRDQMEKDHERGRDGDGDRHRRTTRRRV